MPNISRSGPNRRERRRNAKLARRMVAAAVLPMVAVPTFPSQAAFAAGSTPPVYSLAATVAPAPMTLADCNDPTCIVAPAPSGNDDYPTLNNLILLAAGRTVPAVLDAANNVVTPATTATVFLGEGTYRVGKVLKLPANVNLRGRGITATTVSMITANNVNFNYASIISWDFNHQIAGATSNLVSDLTVNGNCREGAGQPVPSDMPGRPGEFCDFRGADGKAASTNSGGGVSAGDNWTVRQVRFTNLEYFKVWVGNGVTNVRIVDNRFDNWGGAESGDEDNVGGGSRNDGVIVEYNQFDKTIRGNSFDFTNAIRTTVRNNVVRSDGTIATARKDKSLYGNMYFEGIQQAAVTDNVLWGAQIALKSNSLYAHSGENKDITNPRDSIVSGNRISYSGETGISVTYDDYKDGPNASNLGQPGSWTDKSTPTDAFHVVRLGGNNVVRDNVIEYTGRSGIMVNGSYASAKNAADTIAGNVVHNAGWGGSTVYDSGAGYFDTAGIGLSIGVGDQVYGNTIEDDPAKKTTWYGIDLGARRASTSPTGTVLTGPAGEVNTVNNVIGTAYHDQTKISEPVTNLAAGGKVLNWDEAYPLDGRPIRGYRIYRDGNVVGDLPIGSVSIPNNIMTADESNFENASAGTAGWVAGTRTTLTRVAGNGSRGNASMALTSSGTGEVSFSGRKINVTPGQVYTSVLSARAMSTAAAGKQVRAGVRITFANGTTQKWATSNKTAIDSYANWITSYYTFTVPADAVSVEPWYLIEGTVAGDAHLVDRLGLVAGTRTEQFTEANGPANAVYHVVSYTADDNSMPQSVVVP
ncbi:carbohydrate binding domain-containing protein [Actinoplanes sp. NPDC020271]|uniref:carbohydrate binding domain-containing protein n=1 Tax=Actinoplanes sp. NPDC020271 TaxID=3363896 RepID=UPI0037A3E543